MIRAVLVDDEPPARDRLRRLLQGHDDIVTVGAAGDGVEAIRVLEATRPDLVFLDIEMPGLSGFEVVARLTLPRPIVVFCTAFDQYALRAFELNALNYLLKPANRQRLGSALDRVRHKSKELLRLQSEIKVASSVQKRLFPCSLPVLQTLDFSGVCLPAGGVPIGLFPSVQYSQETVRLQPGDVLVAFTDGVTEARNASQEEFGEEQLHDLISAHKGLSAKDLQERILAELVEFSKAVEQHDDLTVVVLKARSGSPQGLMPEG